MSSFSQGLRSQLQGQPLKQLGNKLGLAPTQAASAVAAAVPLLIGALGRNTREPQGAESLFNALQKDHAGLDINSVLGSAISGGGQGEQILDHVFGERRPMAAQGLGSATGLQTEKAHALLRLLAPVVMAYVAKRIFDRRSGASITAPVPPSPQALGDELGHEEVRITKQAGIGGGLLSAVLDRNHDGSVDFSDLTGARGQNQRVG
jgi:hypothetical protein